MKAISILILDDEVRIRQELIEFLSSDNYLVFEAERPLDALEILKKESIVIAIIDIKLPDMNGLEFLKRIRPKYPQLEMIMISGHGDMNSVVEAMRNGASDYFQKPFRLLDVENAIKRSKRFIEIQHQHDKYNSNISILTERLYEGVASPMIGKSKAITEIAEIMERVAQSDDTSVLILGESGTGKELVAHGIHSLSNRKKALFCPINCSAISEHLFESEFFGHKKGSFTGAIEDRHGWFETADKGTIFLDEIGDLPLSQQAKLLRTLQERKVRPVGSSRELDFDVRIIAASNQSLDMMIENKEFRADLYHRLSTIIIKLPPLRDRKEDIPLLIYYFLKFHSNRIKRQIPTITPEAVNLLVNYRFPGNIRELSNIIERTLILCDDDVIDIKHFALGSTNSDKDDSALIQDIYDLEFCEKKAIIKALNVVQFNKAKAAKLLNITWQSLDRKLKKHNIKDVRTFE